MELSRQTFIKLFLDLVQKGFLRTESKVDVISVNNKLAFNLHKEKFATRIQELQQVPSQIKAWMPVN
jgi:dihydroorotase-like cyclic amidohydrolase